MVHICLQRKYVSMDFFISRKKMKNSSFRLVSLISFNISDFNLSLSVLKQKHSVLVKMYRVRKNMFYLLTNCFYVIQKHARTAFTLVWLPSREKKGHKNGVVPMANQNQELEIAFKKNSFSTK